MDYHGESLSILSAAIFSFEIEIYQRRDKSLLTMSKVKKFLAISTSSQNLIDVGRHLKIERKNVSRL